MLLRFFDFALAPSHGDWDIAVAVLAAVSIVVGNAGAIGQDSLKRMLAWSGVAQAGYMLAGVAVATNLGTKSVVFYLLVYLFMNIAAFAVVIARERETLLGDEISGIAGIGASRPVLAWPLTISMLALAGLPGTAGFVGKFFLIEGAVEGSFTWLGSDEEFAQLMKVGYLAAKKANPNAIVSFPGTSYWVDVNSNRALYRSARKIRK